MDQAKRIVEDAGGLVVGAHGNLDDDAFERSAISSDIAMLDINIRGKMSYPLADVLQGRGVPLIFVTGYDFEQIPEKFASVPRLQKPFDANELVNALADTRAKASRTG
ncbi:response regulator [Methylorubrum aminovorans]|uniref:response regulator n=1 Tax=Methylorubrum aminovorans TaxID=269069 RepID=UPI003C2DBD0A